jgi:GH43 family beta-xylosidase
MTYCSEFAVFSVAKENQPRVIALSELLFAEMNEDYHILISHEILKNTDNDEEICWHLVWRNEATVQENSKKWSTFSSSAELESLVGERLYYGHFLPV